MYKFIKIYLKLFIFIYIFKNVFPYIIDIPEDMSVMRTGAFPPL